MDASRFAGGKQFGMGGGGSPNQNRGSAGGMGGDRKAAPTRPLRPATIHQVHSAQHVGDGALVIDGRETGQVTLVGRVLSIDTNQDTGVARSFSYKISDGSGLITVRHWLLGGEEQALEPGTTVRATGTVSHWQNMPILTGTVRPLISGDEITFHLLECILTHNRITKGPRGSAPRGAPGAIAHSQAPLFAAPAGASPRDAVVMCLRRHPHGLTMDELISALQGSLNPNQIRDSLRAMTADGAVFQDNNRYKA